MNDVLGVDVGGANLKYASLSGRAHDRSFALWRAPQRLAEALIEDLKAYRFSPSTPLAVTMTGELADCFLDRAEGVRCIVQQVVRAAHTVGLGEVHFYGVDGRFRAAPQATECPDILAAANWHALASFVGAHVASSGVLVDVGSTTTDLVPIAGGKVATEATTDYQRLREGSLVYIGCRRTPVGALVDRLRFRGGDVPVMKEAFATIDDARLVIGTELEQPEDRDSADGKPRTRWHAANRLARMLGLDHRSVSRDEAQGLARQVFAAARRPILEALAARWRSVPAADRPALVLSGHGADLVFGGPGGDDLVERSAGDNVVELSAELGPRLSRCAPSYAVAQRLRSTLT